MPNPETKVLDQKLSDDWAVYHGDNVEVMRGIPDESIGYTIFSPPFSSLYTYSASDRDMGNCKTDDQFMRHFSFLVKDILRVTKLGRLCSFHCMNLPLSKERDGVIGIKDFRGKLIALFESHGWVFHSEVCIWKDPVTAMQRTKALGLLHKQIVKDSCMSRQGIPDYLVTMRKRGVNPEPVDGPLEKFVGDMTTEEFEAQINRDYYAKTSHKITSESKSMDFGTFLSVNIWQKYASPVWDDIDMGNTLSRECAREEADERHICALQLDVIERGLTLWSNPRDTVLDPFAGIGSTGYKAIQMGRKFIGIELKASYFRQAHLNLQSAEHNQNELLVPDKRTEAIPA